MKIENKVNNYKIFGELERGDVFILGDEVYMKTDGDDGKSNAVSLESGYKIHVYQDAEVHLVKATLTIE